MATDATGRAVVNQSMAETFSVKRLDLVTERRDRGLNYGGLFVAHELAKNGLAMKDILNIRKRRLSDRRRGRRELERNQ